MGSHHSKPNGNPLGSFSNSCMGEWVCWLSRDTILGIDSNDLDSIRWVTGPKFHEGYILENGGSIKGALSQHLSHQVSLEVAICSGYILCYV